MEANRISTTSVLLLTCLILVIGSGQASAQRRPNVQPFVNIPEGCYFTEQPDLDSLYTFTKTQIQALSMARRGEVANLDVLASKEDLPLNEMSEMITGMREERIQNTCAAFIMSAFGDSKNETAAMAAKVLALSYQQLMDLTDQMLGIVLQGTRDRTGASTRAVFLQWKLKRQETMNNMTQALNISLSLLVDESRKNADGKPDHLILTRTQRDGLLNYLTSKFPSLEKEKKIKHSGDFMEQVLLIQSFLTGNYKPSDSQ